MLKKYKESIFYLIFGGLTFITNIITYTLCTRILNIDILISNCIAWIISVLFAYVTNKFFVFESKKINIKFLIKELSSFVSCRLLSGIIEMILMYTMISLMSLNDFIVKIITNVVVVILNFIFSKLIIFKNK